MDIQAKIEMNRRNIWQAVDDYRAHTCQTYGLDSVSEKFVKRLAEDNAYAKAELRDLFRKSPVWNEELDCLIINGTRTHNPDTERIQRLADEILYDWLQDATYETNVQLDQALHFFTYPVENHDHSIEMMKALAPKAYAPWKKPSRIFRALCDALGVSDDTAGSRFQRLYAQFADELSAKKIDFKLYVSLNPAHFITMSNPKDDRRGSMLTSCHSFNSTEYPYNCGCSGYARDNYTFITFIAADPANPETLNNRKTMRQIFAYKPYNGLLLQSRLYNTDGGSYGGRQIPSSTVTWYNGRFLTWRTWKTSGKPTIISTTPTAPLAREKVSAAMWIGSIRILTQKSAFVVTARIVSSPSLSVLMGFASTVGQKFPPSSTAITVTKAMMTIPSNARSAKNISTKPIPSITMMGGKFMSVPAVVTVTMPIAWIVAATIPRRI